MKKQAAKRKQFLSRGGMILLMVLVILFTSILVRSRDRLTIGHLVRGIEYNRPGSRNATEFRFTSLSSNTFATLGRGLAVASSSGLSVYDRTGSQVYASYWSLEQPVIRTQGNFVIAYDLGGTDILVGNQREALRHIEAEGRIIDARINESGWVTVSVEQVGTLGMVRLYDPDGVPRFRVQSATGHLMGAALAEDNLTLTLLTMTEAGGRILWYTAGTPADEPNFAYQREGEVFFDFWFASAHGDVGVISNNVVVYLNAKGEVQSEYQFPDQRLRAYDIERGDVALHLSHHQTGAGGEIVVLEPRGERERMEVTGNVIDISMAGRYVAAICFEGITVYRRGRIYASFEETEGMTHVRMRSDGTLFRLAQQRARLLVP